MAGINRIDPTGAPVRMSTNLSVGRQTPKTDFGDRVKAGLDTAAGAVATGAAVAAPLVPGGAILSAAVSSVTTMSQNAGGAVSTQYSAVSSIPAPVGGTGSINTTIPGTTGGTGSTVPVVGSTTGGGVGSIPTGTAGGTMAGLHMLTLSSPRGGSASTGYLIDLVGLWARDASLAEAPEASARRWAI